MSALPPWPESPPQAVLAAQAELAYLEGFIPRPRGVWPPDNAYQRRRRKVIVWAWLAARGF